MSWDTQIDLEEKEYHVRDGELLLDEDGEPIPMTTCICFAHSSSECCCGSWDRVEVDYE